MRGNGLARLPAPPLLDAGQTSVVMSGPADAQAGCDYCRDPGNLLYGHVPQIATSDEEAHGLLLRCPRCGTLYEDPANGQYPYPITPEEASQFFPDWSRSTQGNDAPQG
jgi:hypothetical protein